MYVVGVLIDSENSYITTSIDQRLQFFKYSQGDGRLFMIDSCTTQVADVKGIAKADDYIIIYGCGYEIFRRID